MKAEFKVSVEPKPDKSDDPKTIIIPTELKSKVLIMTLGSKESLFFRPVLPHLSISLPERSLQTHSAMKEDDWTQQFTVNPLSAGTEALPIAHTCFFSIDLPPYRSVAQMRRKLLYAIFNCTAIDVDFNPEANSTLNAWVE
eukprot:g44238.t1